MRNLARLALISSLIPAAGYAHSAALPQCSSILPPEHLATGKRPLTPYDLARLRDIGPVEPQFFVDPSFAISPDRRKAAFQLRQGDPARNSYCLAMIVLDLTGRTPPTIVDEGSDPILLTLDFRGVADFPIGILATITPRWSPDNRWFAFLKRSGGITQVWRALADGSGSEPLTNSDIDIGDFRISADGLSIIYTTHPGIAREQREIDKEGLNGWHYDDRFNPFVSKRPFARSPTERHIQVLDVSSGKLRDPTPSETETVVGNDSPASPGAMLPTNVEGLEIAATSLSATASRGSLRAHLANGRIESCNAPECEGALNPWWTQGKTHVRFRRWEGWAKASTAIYDWDLVTGVVRRIYFTDDLLTSCTGDGRAAICLRHSSLVPGRLVRLDLVSGNQAILFDPNPEFAHLTLGEAERLHWRNAFGVETVADLVLPVGYRRGVRYPLVVVQYDTRGFLRGGTDDEYPIQAFANRGYAVLSFKRPAPLSLKSEPKDFEQMGRLNLEQFTDRRNVQSALEAGVKLAIARGIADPARLGITGLSDGSSTVEWEILHSSLFSAAATSSCCWDSALVAEVGPGTAKHFLTQGYPGVLERDAPFWKQVALGENARRISTPILINASEEEFLDTLLTYTALREAGDPVDLFEYPGEYHGRWQPAHRLATYRRSLDWFDYWLRGVRSDAPDRQAELKTWDRLKEENDHKRGS